MYKASLFLAVFGLAAFFYLLSASRKHALKPYLQALILAFGFFIFGQGISNLSTAGSINAILTYESAREIIAQAPFDHLHETLDPTLMSGYMLTALGALIVGAAIVRK